MRQTRCLSHYASARRSAFHVLAAALVCVLSLVACSDSVTDLYVADGYTTSGTVGPFVETSNILLTATSFYAYPGVDGIIIDIDRADTREPLRIGAGDVLTVSLNGSSYPLEEVRGYTCDNYYTFSNCRYIYYYRVFFPFADPSGKDLILDFQRTNANSVTTVTFPLRAAIIQPAAGVTVDLSADDLVVSWVAGSAGDEMYLELNGSCGVATSKLYFNDSAANYTFPANTFAFYQGYQSCRDATELPLPIHTFRSRTYAADAALSPLSSITLSLNDEISVTVVP